ncbi:MAG: GGDEF domain-containing protein [Proteobacteria bacterium]|jgi:two-component system cell cycle response regulator|nr:GGDEF domain-containing protein [Pseudomonadota bacterium]MDA1301250.1 GGDEF domain-containing protein [Pseudomonadota bacterium]
MSDNTEYRKLIPDAEEEVRTAKRPCLIMIKGDFIGQVYELTNDVTMIGRSDELDLVVSDISISRKHAMIVARVDGYYLSDLNSTNGSFLNREPVLSAVKLAEGDKVQLGNVVFKFSFQDEDDTEYHLMLRNMAVKDGLTRIYNKRYFSESLDKEFEYNRRNEVGLAIILLDIDYFKQINDTWGHPAGDFILKHMAQLIEEKARGYDVFARYGGEEFAFMLRGAPLPAAVQLAERVRTTIEQQVFVYDGVELKITISAGVVWWGGDDAYASPDELIEACDRFLYKAKERGRNQVVHQATTE